MTKGIQFMLCLDFLCYLRLGRDHGPMYPNGWLNRPLPCVPMNHHGCCYKSVYQKDTCGDNQSNSFLWSPCINALLAWAFFGYVAKRVYTHVHFLVYHIRDSRDRSAIIDQTRDSSGAIWRMFRRLVNMSLLFAHKSVLWDGIAIVEAGKD